MGKMRATRHNGRVRKNGTAYDPDHDCRKAERTLGNIDPARTPLNRYWAIGSRKWYGPSDDRPPFSEVEAAYYEHFRPMYEASRERSRKRGQLKRVRPFEEWRQSRQFVPEETYLQVGCVDDGTVDAKTFVSCVSEYLVKEKEWNNAHNKPFTVLTMGYHFDEEIPQFHQRKVWHSVDPETGIDEIGQEKALERAGVPLPDPSKPVGKDNNRKMTFDAEMREIWLDILESHGLDIEREPLKGVKHNQSKGQWLEEKAKQAAKKASHEATRTRKDALAKAIEYQENAEKAADKYVYQAQGAIDLLKMERDTVAREIADKVAELGDMDDYPEYRRKRAAERAQEAQEAARKEQEAQESRNAAGAARRPQEAQEAPAVRLARDAEEISQDAQEIASAGMWRRVAAKMDKREQASGPTAVEGPTL